MRFRRPLMLSFPRDDRCGSMLMTSLATKAPHIGQYRALKQSKKIMLCWVE